MPASYYKEVTLMRGLTTMPVKLKMAEKLKRPYRVSKKAARVLAVAVPSWL